MSTRKLPISWRQIDLEPPPTRKHASNSRQEQLRQMLKQLTPGSHECIVWPYDSRLVHRAAEDLGVEVKTWKLAKGGFRVWRLQ